MNPAEQSGAAPEKLSICFGALLKRQVAERLLQKPEDALDWVMNVSILRRHLYALATTVARIGLDPADVPDIDFQVIYHGVPGERSRYEFKVTVPVWIAEPGPNRATLWWGYTLELARFTDHKALTAPSKEHVGEFLIETAAMASSVFNDQEYLDFVHVLADSPESGIPPDSVDRTKGVVAIERVYRAVQWDGDSKALTLFRRDDLRLPKQYLDGTVIENRSGDVLNWDDGVGVAIHERRWRSPDVENPYGYIRTVARRILENAIKEDAGTDDWISATKHGIKLESLIRLGRNAEEDDQRDEIDYRENVIRQDGEDVAIDLKAAYSAGGFDPEMIAYVDARLSGMKLREMPAYLTAKMGSPWTAAMVDAARKRIGTARKKVQHLWSLGARPEPGVDLQTLTYYRQRFHPSLRWAYAHIFDDGDARMPGARGYGQMIAFWRNQEIVDFILVSSHYSAAPWPMMFWDALSKDTFITKVSGVRVLNVPRWKKRKTANRDELKKWGIPTAGELTFEYVRHKVDRERMGFLDPPAPVVWAPVVPKQRKSLSELFAEASEAVDTVFGYNTEGEIIGNRRAESANVRRYAHNRAGIYCSLESSKTGENGTHSHEGVEESLRIREHRLGFNDVAGYHRRLTWWLHRKVI